MSQWIPLLLSALLTVSSIQAVLPSMSSDMEIAQEETVVDLPYALQDRVTLSLYNGSSLSAASAHLSIWPDKQAFLDILPQVKGRAVANWSVPEKPWPLYELTIWSGQGRYTALYCDGVWADSLGNTLKAEVNFPALWKAFGEEPDITEGVSLPVSRTLALRDGWWDARFLHPSGVEEILTQVPMTVESGENGLSWTIVNRSGRTLFHGNGGDARLEVLLEEQWYVVPLLEGPNWAVTLEGYLLQPGESFSAPLWQEIYGDLPGGTYRVTFPLDTKLTGDSSQEAFHGDAAAPFQLGEGWTLLPENAGANSK